MTGTTTVQNDIDALTPVPIFGSRTSSQQISIIDQANKVVAGWANAAQLAAGSTYVSPFSETTIGGSSAITALDPYVNANVYAGGLTDALNDSSNIGKTVLVTDAQSLNNYQQSTSVMVEVVSGGLINLTGANSFVNAPLAGRYVIFAGTGTITFPGSVFPEWWGAKADATLSFAGTDSTGALQAAVECLQTYFAVDLAGLYKITSPIAISGAHLAITGPGGIVQSTESATGINVAADDFQYNCTLIGNPDLSRDGDVPTGALYAGIWNEGTNSSFRSGFVLAPGTSINGFEFGVACRYNSGFLADDININGCMTGILGGAAISTDENLTSYDYLIANSRITCTYGSLEKSRPLAFPYAAGNRLITGCTLRGGGMAFENVFDSSSLTVKPTIKILNNNCDTSISGGTEIIGNTIDAANSPAGRGPMYAFSYFQAIEPGTSFGGIISHNVIRNYANAIGTEIAGCTIDHNTIDSCGSAVSGAAGNGGLINHTNANSNQDINTRIVFNLFLNSSLTCIYINWSSTGGLSSGLEIVGNISDTNTEGFLLVKYADRIIFKDNILIDSNTAINTSQAFEVWEQGTVAAQYDGNKIYRTSAVAAGYGTINFTADQGASVYGYNESSGLRGQIYFAWPALFSSDYFVDNGVRKNYKSVAGLLGIAGLASGSATVLTSAVTTNSRIILTRLGAGSGGVTNFGYLYIAGITAGASFMVSSSNALDDSNFTWEIIPWGED